MYLQPTSAEFSWSASEQNILLTSGAYGAAVLQIPGGMLGERFGGKVVSAIFMSVAALASLTVPIVARWSYVALVVNRVVAGLALVRVMNTCRYCENNIFKCIVFMK